MLMLPTKRKTDLLKNLDNFTDLERIRYTSSHPCDMTIDLIEAHKECSKLMPNTSSCAERFGQNT